MKSIKPMKGRSIQRKLIKRIRFANHHAKSPSQSPKFFSRRAMSPVAVQNKNQKLDCDTDNKSGSNCASNDILRASSSCTSKRITTSRFAQKNRMKLNTPSVNNRLKQGMKQIFDFCL